MARNLPPLLVTVAPASFPPSRERSPPPRLFLSPSSPPVSSKWPQKQPNRSWTAATSKGRSAAVRRWMAPILRYLVLLHTIYVLNGGDRHWRLRSPATPRPTFRMVMLVVEYGAVELGWWQRWSAKEGAVGFRWGFDGGDGKGS